MGMGLRFEQDRHSDDGICAVGRWDLVKIGQGNWNRTPPPPPSGPSQKNSRNVLSTICDSIVFVDIGNSDRQTHSNISAIND